MKILALALAFALQTTGLWPHLDESTRNKIAHQAVGQPASNISPSTTDLPPVTSLTLPIRTNPDAPKLETTTSVLALDRTSATPLYAQNDHQQRPIASITKLVTALVILSRHDPDDTVTIPQLPKYGPEDYVIGLTPGDKYQLSDLVKAALVPSANDAADALAIYDSGSPAKFASQMNSKMAAWDISGTHFTNPSGLQDTGNYATATALGKIALLSLENPVIQDAVKEPFVTIRSTSGRTLSHTSTNILLPTGQFHGIKTGYTLAAGQCFVGLTRIDGHDVITVVLGSKDRFGQTQSLVNWIGRSYQWL